MKSSILYYRNIIDSKQEAGLEWIEISIGHTY